MTEEPDRRQANDDTKDDYEDGDKEEQRERYRELLEELRTVIPGVQVLMAFLLTVPFSGRFAEVDDLGKRFFAASLLLAVIAVLVFLTPAAYHRVAPRRDRSDRLRFGVRLAVVGMALTGLAIGLALFVVIRFIFDSTALGATFGLLAGITSVVLWYAVPLSQRVDRGESDTGR